MIRVHVLRELAILLPFKTLMRIPVPRHALSMVSIHLGAIPQLFVFPVDFMHH